MEEEKECSKFCYPCKKDALTKLNALRKGKNKYARLNATKYHFKHRAERAYYCAQCNAWHLTHKKLYF